jgi:hypothetical protein
MGSIVSSILGTDNMEAAANTAAQQQEEAARKAGYAASFRPVGISTRFGSSQFTEEIDPVSGLPRVTAAGYTTAPELRSIQDRLLGLAPGALTQAEQAQMQAMPLGRAATGLFNLGEQYLAESPEALRQRYINQQMALLEPGRQREEQRLASSVFGRGRAGLNIGDIGQPELYSLASARRQQDLALAAQAEQQAQQQLGYGASLFGTGASILGQQYAIPTQSLAPVQSYLGTAGTIEEMAQQPFQLGMQVGGAGAQAGSAAGSLLGSGLAQAAQTRYQGVQQATQANVGFLSGLIQAGAGMATGGMSTAAAGATGGGYFGGIGSPIPAATSTSQYSLLYR